jgi:DNA polymerase-3 subunit alpha
MAKVKDQVARGKQLGMPALGITDHGNICGTYEFYMACMEAGIEPILGSEFYFVPEASAVRDDKDAERFHVTIVARNEAGFQTLVELSDESHRNFYYKPLIDRKMLRSIPKKDRKNLVVLSGCAGSIISRKLSKMFPDQKPLKLFGDNPEYAKANDELAWWASTFPNFYIELMHHGTDFDRRLNRRLLGLATRHGLPWVVTNDPHFVMKEEACHHDALLAIQTAAQLDDEERFRFHGKGYHLRSYREMERAFRKYGDEIWLPGAAATIEIAKTCKTRIPAWDSRSWHIPKFPGVDDAHVELRRRAWAGLRRLGLEDNKIYVKRLKHELREFKNVSMADFLLITADADDHAREQKIRIGPGRGSVCGTLVGYCIGIHKVDPIKYDLLFERFLNPERPKMPDVDTDFQRSRRPEMFAYAEKVYGRENVMRVAAQQRMQTKDAFTRLAMTYGMPYAESKKFTAAIIEDEEGNAVLPDEIEKAFPELHATLVQFTGLNKGMSRHPAGILIFDPNDPVRKLIPEMWIPSDQAAPHPLNGRKGNFVAQFDLDVASGIGLLKQDFLGLRTLDTIQVCIDLVKARHGVTIEPDDWVPGEEPDDTKVWKMLREGHTVGVFQMEGGANARGIQEIKCGEFEDIVSCTSLYRAGPMIAGAPKRFLENKKDKKIRVAHKSLRPYLERSWGELIYQEQMFEILRQCAGFSWARVDDAKTAMTKKDPVKMAALKEEAIEGFQKVSGMEEWKASEVWDLIAAQSSYLFNRSHAVAYSILTYQTARLKMLYPLEFMCALLRTVNPDSKQAKEKRETYMTEALRMGFKLMPPDVNVSDDKFMPNGNNELLFGLTDIKNVGPSAVTKIEAARKRKIKRLKKQGKKVPSRLFRRVSELADAINNAGVIKALAASGALRSLGVEPDIAMQEELLNWQFHDHVAPFRKKYEKKIRMPRTNNGRVLVVGEIIKTEKRKTKTGNEFTTWVLRLEPGTEIKVQIWEDAIELFGLQKGTIVKLEGRWNAQWSNVAVDDAEQVKTLRRITKTRNKPNKKESAA